MWLSKSSDARTWRGMATLDLWAFMEKQNEATDEHR